MNEELIEKRVSDLEIIQEKHETRIDKLEIDNNTFNLKIDSLIKSMDKLNSTLTNVSKWFLTSVGGFILLAILKLIIK